MGWNIKPVTFIKEVTVVHKKSTAEIENYIYRQIVARSPEDTGAYQSNHNRTKNAPDFGFNPMIRSGQQPQPSFGFFDTLHISNGAPYAGVIEHGRPDTRHVPLYVYKRALQDAKAKFGL